MTTPTESPTTFEFTTPESQTRAVQVLTVDLCGEELTLRRPKDWSLTNISTIAADDVPHETRAQAILRYIHGALGEDGHEQLLRRSLDRSDPLNLGALLDFIGRTHERWTNFDEATNTPIVIAAGDGGITGTPARLLNRDLDIDLIAEPPKDLVLMVLAATAGRSAAHSQRWAVEYFLQAVLAPDDLSRITRRLTDPNDILDVEHLDPMISQLVDHWSSALEITTPGPANRAERRAAARAGSAHMGGDLAA